MAEEIVQDDPKLTVDQFATKLKTKYPEYKDIDNKELVGKMLTKYPEYESKVIMGDGVVKKPLATASSSGVKPSKSGSLISQDFPTGTNPNSTQGYIGLTNKGNQIQQSQDDVIRQSKASEQERISKSLNNVLSSIPKSSRDLVTQMASYRADNPDRLTAPTKEEREHQDFMNTNTGKLLGGVAYLGSKATKGTLQIAKGAAWLADNTVGAALDKITDNDSSGKTLGEQVEKLDKVSEYGLTKSDVANYEGSKALRNLGGLVEILPAAATGGATSNAAVFALQGMGQGKEVVDDLKKNGQKIDPWVEKAFITGTGVINGVLMGNLGRSLFSKVPANLRREVVAGITADAIKESAGKELTGDAFKDLLENGAKKWSDRVAKFGVDALTHYKRTVIDLSKFNAANFVLKQATDVANSSGPVFNETLGDLAEGLKSVAVEQAPFFAAAGQIGDIGKLTKYSSYKNDAVESLMADPSPENIDRIKQNLYDYGFSERKADRWSPEEMDATFKQVDNIANVASRLPRNIKASKLVDAVDYINGRDELLKQKEAITQAKQGFDESVRNIPTPEEELIDNKIDQANDKLQEAVTGKTTKYEANEENGKYTKTTPTGETVAISKSRYELEQLEKEARRTARDEQVSKFQQNFPEYAETLVDDLPNQVGHTLDKVDNNKRVTVKDLSDASDWLYGKYKKLLVMKDSDTRQYTIKQIEDISSKIESDIESLEKYKETAGFPVEDIASIPLSKPEPQRSLKQVKEDYLNGKLKTDTLNEPANIETPIERGQPEPVVSEVPKPTEPAEVNSAPVVESSPAATEANKEKAEIDHVQKFKEDKATSKISFSDAADRVIKDEPLNPIQIETLNKFKEIFKDSNVFHSKDFKFGMDNELLKGEDYGATIDLKGNNILIFKENNFEYRTLVHEAAHILSFKALNDSFPEFNKKYKSEIQDAFNKAKEALGDNEEFNYAFSNLDEFVAEAFGNHDFQAQLSYIKSSGSNTTLFESIIRSIRSLIKELYDFDIEQSVLEDIMVATENLSTTKRQGEEVKPKNKSVKVESAKNENINAKVEAQGVELEDTVGETRSNSVVNKEAGKAIRDGYDPRELVEKILKDKYQATDTEVAILAKHIDATEQRLIDIDKRLESDGANMSKADFDDLTNERSRALTEFQDVAQAAKQTGTASARALSARRFEVNRDYSLANMITRKREANGGEKLSESQLTDVTNRFKELEVAQKALEAKVKQLEADNSRLKADKAIKAAERTKRKSVTKEELATERKQIVSDFRSELAKIRKTTSAVAIPYARELAAAAPFVARMVRNLATEGIVEIADVIKRVHEEFATDIPDMTTDDVRDIIAGVYSEPRRTREDLEAQVRALKTQAVLLRKIEDAEAGLPKASTAKAKTISTEVEKLRERLTEIEKRSELPQEEKDLNTAKKRIQARIDEINEKLTNGGFEKKGAPQGLVLDKEGLELRREYDRLKHGFDIEVAKEALQQRTKSQKIKDNALNLLSLPRALKATLDFSAVLRQGLILGIGHPTKAVEALKQMFGQTFSQKKYDDWLSDIKHTPEYDLMVKSDLYISEKNNPDLIAREEEFTSNLAERIPLINAPIKLSIKGKAVNIPGLQLISGAERAYSAYLNAIRTGVFIDEAAKLQERGYTFENNPEQFKALAKVVNVLSGRGDIPEVLGGKQPKLLASALFSPRFMASRIQTLYLWADPRLPKEARVLAAKDLGKTLATAATIMTLAQLSGMTVEKDPRSTDFLKLKNGNTRYDILAGLAPYVVFLAQQLTGKKKPTTNRGMIDLAHPKSPMSPTRLTLATNFMRGKLAPVPGIGVNLLGGKDIVGQEYSYKSIPGEFVPLPISDIKGAADVGGWENSLKVLVPAIFGIGVSSYDANAKKKPTWAKE